MDDAPASLARVCIERGWRFVRLGDERFVFDESAEYLVRVDADVAGGLPRTTARGLRAAITQLEQGHDALDAPTAEGHVVSLLLLGVRVDVCCRHAACARDVTTYYSASPADPATSSPEVIVWCDWDSGGRYLFRSRPDEDNGSPLHGVDVQTLGTDRSAWTSSLPPIPPLDAWPFRDRFVALHASAIRTAGGSGVLILGERGAGKSLAALSLVQDADCALLGDETAFVHVRTTIVEPYPHAVGVWRDGAKTRVPVTDVCERIWPGAVPVTRLVFLERDPASAPSRTERVAPAAALRALLSHHRDGGAALGVSLQTLMILAERTEAWSLRYATHTELPLRLLEAVIQR